MKRGIGILNFLRMTKHELFWVLCLVFFFAGGLCGDEGIFHHIKCIQTTASGTKQADIYFYTFVSIFYLFEMVLQFMFYVLCMLILMLMHVVLKALFLWRNCPFGDITVHETTSAYQATLKLTSATTILFFHPNLLPLPNIDWFMIIAVDLWHDLQKLL